MNRSLTPEQTAKAVELYTKHGLSTSALAERYQTTNRTMIRILKRAGCQIEARRYRNDSCGGLMWGQGRVQDRGRFA